MLNPILKTKSSSTLQDSHGEEIYLTQEPLCQKNLVSWSHSITLRGGVCAQAFTEPLLYANIHDLHSGKPGLQPLGAYASSKWLELGPPAGTM